MYDDIIGGTVPVSGPVSAAAAQPPGGGMYDDIAPPVSATRNIPIVNYPEVQQEMAKEGLGLMGAGYRLAMHDPRGLSWGGLGKGALGMAAGATEYAGSPLWAAYRSAIGEPVERLTGGRIPKEYPEFAAQLATPGIGLVRSMAPPMPPPAARTPLLQAAQDLNIALPRAVTSESMPVQMAGKVLENVPVAGWPVRSASTRAIGQLKERAGEARDLLGSGQPAAAGAAVREGIENTLERGPMRRRIDALYNRVDHMVNPTALGPMPETRQAAIDIEARRAGAGLPRSAVNQALDEILARGGITYQGIKDLRSHFGEMLANRAPIPEGMARTEVERIYGALSGDLRGVVANAGGPDALRVWERANATAARWAQTRQRLAAVLKAPSDEALVDKLTAMTGERGGNLEQLLRVRNSIPAEHWDELGSAIMGRMGWRPGSAGFSPDAFLTAYNKMAPQARALVFGDVAPTIDNIATVSQRYKELAAFANPSGTGRQVIGFEMMLHPVLALKAAAGGLTAGRFLASPEGPGLLQRWLNAQRGPMGVRQMANRVFAAEAARGTGTAPQDVLDQMQGPRQ
jgi:hypothetical protein